MHAFQCLRAAVRPTATSLIRPSIIPTQHRFLSLLSHRRPVLLRTSAPSTLNAPGTTSTLPPFSSEILDLVGKISSHPALSSLQIRCGPRDTYNPSHLVRKRRHGFLSRIRTKKGRKLLMRRLKKGRWNLSH